MTIATYPDLSGKVVLVTGSSKALGAETARQFAQAGAKVVVNGRNAEKIEQVAASSQIEPWLPPIPSGLCSLSI